MTLELTYPHIETGGAQAPRLKRLPRVRVAQIVMDYFAHGWSVDEMCRQHPDLMPVEAHSALAYYYDHQDQIEEEIRLELDQIQMDKLAGHTSPFFMRMRAKGIL